MNEWLPRTIREAALAYVEARLANEPEAFDPAFERACLLAELGRGNEAQAAYLELLKRQPTHAGVLNNLGKLLLAGGHRSAARTAYAYAAKCNPDDPMGHVNFANLLLEDGEIEPARAHYEAAVRLAPDLTEAHCGFANLLAEVGDEAAADRHRDLAFKGRPITMLPYRGTGAPVPVVLLISAAGGNVPLVSYLDEKIFLTYVVVAEYLTAETPLPPHCLIVNAVGDADRCQPGLKHLSIRLASEPAPLLNRPEAVMPTGRLDNLRHLSLLADVVTPRAALLTREVLAGEEAASALAAAGLFFPLLLRAPGFHTGRHFLRVERPEDLRDAVAELPGDELLALEFLAAATMDGWTRKYRVMTIGGRLYPLHLAVSRDWKVHYFSSGMADHAELRAEEAAFLGDMPKALGDKALAALERIAETLGLDYGGIDFALDAAGRVLLFEANATMIVPPAPEGEVWAYRRPAYETVQAAIRTLFATRASEAPTAAHPG